tara:strand:+ start:11665 stop:13248 length:1584 start_codon:yes stop_codon:yes gene_type:complete
MNNFSPSAAIKDINMSIVAEAVSAGIMPARLLIERGSYKTLGAINYWDAPIMSDSLEPEERGSKIKLAEEKNLLSDLCWSISKAIQFPVNTIYAHGMGVVASAMSKSFSFEYGHGTKPVNLYVVTAQPPSTGKSGVNELLVEPVHHAFDTINEKAIVERKKAKIRMSAIKRELKDAAKNPASTEEQKFALEDEMTALYKSHDKHVVYTYALDDATPEATAKIALGQNGLFNIISAEADAINIILGGVYSDKKANFGIFLKGWDSERHHVARASQEVMSGRVTGNICVIAQDESIRTILAAGESGRGISERFLLVRESTYLGKRVFNKGVKVCDTLLAKYSKLIFNIVREDGVTLQFSAKSKDLINEYRSTLEPEMADSGRYGNNMMRGFMGKADKQIMKIASVLHVIDNWAEKGDRSTQVRDSTTRSAIKFFKDIAESYITAADELGFTGCESEYIKVEEKLQQYAEKGKLTMSVAQLRSNLKNIKPFTGTPNLTHKLKNILLPAMESNNICVVHDGKIHINPYLKG